jgi:hypothetical protein
MSDGPQVGLLEDALEVPSSEHWSAVPWVQSSEDWSAVPWVQ